MNTGSNPEDPGREPEYPTWIKPSRTRMFLLLTVAICVVAAIIAILWPPGWALALLALPFLYIDIVLVLSSWRLSPRGDDLQARIHRLVIDSVGDGYRLLDVGCGSGQMIVAFAKEQPGDYVGLDFWLGEWGQYAHAQAQQNAALEEVPGIEFVHGSASSLPFGDASFDRVVSSLTFHEVQDVTDKSASLAEVIRVLKPGGYFAFVDLFDDPAFYPSRERVLESIQSAGGIVQSSQSLAEMIDLKWPMNTGKVLKHAVLITGKKSSP